MKTPLLLLSLILVATMLGCAKESKDKTLAGFKKPGDFRPKGVLDTKEFTFADGRIPSCAASATCPAVYANWPVVNPAIGVLIQKGLAISDKNEASPSFNLKIYQTLTGWKLILVLNGYKYARDIDPNDMQITFQNSAIMTLPECLTTSLPPCHQDFEEKGPLLVEATILFLNNIVLELEPGDPSPITITAGDRIVAQAHNVSVP